MAKRITVIGTGYLGATHAACMAELGFEVLGVDIDPVRIAALAGGQLPFYEQGLDDLVRRHVGLGRLKFTTSLAQAAEFGDVHFLCVGTPQRGTAHAPDLSQIESVITGLAPHLHRPCLIVGKSTVPAGTARTMAEHVRNNAPVGELAEVAWNPEFLREGHAVADTLSPDRLVFGVQSDWAVDVLAEVYADLIERRTPVVVTDIETAELTKLAANAFLATKISFMNALSEICDAVGADVVTLASALAYDPRIGDRFLQSGAGFGGGCLPKDIRILAGQASEVGVTRAAALLHEVDTINLHCRQRLVEMARQECGGDLGGRRVCVLGAAFKPNSDDVRDSPALAIASAIHAEGARVTIYDPRAIENARKTHPGIGYAASVTEAARHADVILLLTEWPEFRNIDPGALAGLVRQRSIVDGRIALDPTDWMAAGWTYRAPGRPGGGVQPAQLSDRALDQELADARYLSSAEPIGG